METPNIVPITIAQFNFDTLYILFALVGSLTIRIISSSLKSITSPRPFEGFWNRFWTAFLGFGTTNKESGDYWHSFILGFLELLTIPALLAVGWWQIVGGWIALKLVPQFRLWESNRPTFNRFLIANLSMLLIAGYMTKLVNFSG